jgi:hypothetical protein
MNLLQVKCQVLFPEIIIYYRKKEIKDNLIFNFHESPNLKNLDSDKCR